MAIKTTTEKLENVQSAIEKAENAVEVGLGDKRIVRERLNILYAREKELIAQLARENGTGGPSFNVGIRSRAY